MRLIDGNALMKRLGIAYDCRECDQDKSPYCTWKPDVVDVCQIISDAPTIEERKKGKWIRMSDADGDYYCCDQCGEELPRYMTEIPSWDRPYPHKQSIDKTNFCLNCGSDMRGEQDDSE